MDELAIGSEAWWMTITGPQHKRVGEYEQVTFWWRDPAGDETTSVTRRVWIYITGVTDHHHHSPPQTLERIPHTDVWHWTTMLPPTWRGSYCFIPSIREDDFSPILFHAGIPDRMLLREGWRQLLPQAIADPLNPLSWQGGRGHAMSGLEMPQAPEQAGWSTPAEQWNTPQCITWRSERLGNQRRVWVFTTGATHSGPLPLAILLDGQFWAQSMPIWPALTALTVAGRLPAAVYLLIDVIDIEHRSAELPCHADFWLALQQELLPQVQAMVPVSDQPEQTIVAGQSFGGLSALYAGLHWPERFGCVLSQSGSYWWPHRGGQQIGQLLEQLQKGKFYPEKLTVFLEAGKREPLIFQVNQDVWRQLQQRKTQVFWRQIEGGHDALCWRGGLTDGLMTLWGSHL